MRLVFAKIKIKNFKGVLEKELEFATGKNIIQGENGIGKTSILDAITWCLFGKNFADEKQFKIKPIIDGEEKQNLTTSVELTVNDKTIERTWENDKTTIKVDGVRFGNREFSDYLRDNLSITDEEFKALSNVEYIPKLHWKDLRSLIMGLVGEIKNDEVFEQGNFELIKNKIESVGVEKTATDITETKSKLNEAVKKILGNIDQKTKDIKDLVIDEEEQHELQTQKEIIRNKIDNYNQLKQEKAIQEDKISKLEQMNYEKKYLKKEIERLEDLKNQYQETYRESAVDENILRENEIKKFSNKIQNIKQDIELLEQEKLTLAGRRSELREKYEKELQKEVHIEDNHCAVCGQTLPNNKIQEYLKKAKEEAIEIANGYATQASRMKSRIDEIDIVLNKYKQDIEELSKEIELTKTKEYNSIESELQISMKNKIVMTDLELQKCTQNITKLDEEIIAQEKIVHNILDKEKVVIPGNIEYLQEELESITKKLAISDTLEIFKEQLKDLENQYNNLLKDKEILLEKEQQLIAFNNLRSSMLKQRVKHNFSLVDFITQEETKDGKLIETFKIAINGVEYSSLNTGHKTLVALDLIDNIQRMKNKRLPILIDGLGELTRLPNLDTQIIGCRAKFQVQKKMEIVEE